MVTLQMEQNTVITLKQCMMKDLQRPLRPLVELQIVGFPAPPTNVYAEVWDEEVSLYWTEPDVSNLGVPYTETFDEGGLLIYGLLMAVTIGFTTKVTGNQRQQ